ncbi:hypothetical protein [Clostridium sp. BNL1100]|uniref:hypothetical protein n=1 Tax=Clostridium sp. BNL1100 TaxID=755731 RepID=UPI00024A7EF5|nr:hypothetical protein [Clostridium sp. BNL1100]AEY65390.1 hypothetical protein Clo1100_1138 [Clostridium sp. BNL1100]
MLGIKASIAIGDIVTARTEFKSKYIAQIIDINYSIRNCLSLKILACTFYPSQKALLYKDVYKERFPLVYESLYKCGIDSIETYSGTIPEYYELMPRVLEETFLIETEADREIYERHKKYWNEMRGGRSATG